LPTISVIMPAYNAGRLLDTSLASLAAQTRPPDEVVVVDDASTDNTLRVASRWRAILPITLVRHSENLGCGASRVSGIERSSGELISFLDADDYLSSPDHLALLEQHWLRHGGIVTSVNQRWIPGEGASRRTSIDLVPIPPPDAQATAILDHNFLSAASLFARSDYDAAGGGSDRRVVEDWDLWIRMIHHGVRVSAPDTPTMLYRTRPDSLSADDACLVHDIDLLHEVEHQVAPVYRPLVQRSMRRRRARQLFLEGISEARAEHWSAARRRWLRAALVDRSLRGGHKVSGSVTLRALVCLLAPAPLARRLPRVGNRSPLGLALPPEASAPAVTTEQEGGPSAGRAVEIGKRAVHLGRSVPRRAAARVSNRGAILMYHRIVDLDLDPWGIAVSPARFAEHIAALADGPWHPVAMDELIGRVRRGEDTRQLAAVTFDDGYADNLVTALPILERHEVPATVYVATGTIGAHQEFWWDELGRLLLDGATLPRRLDVVIDDERFRYDLGPDADAAPDITSINAGWRARSGPPPTRRHDLYEQLWQRISSLGPAQTNEVVEALRTWAGRSGSPRPTHRQLTRSELSELAAHPLVSIGSHTVSHSSLPVLDPDTRHQELAGAKSELEDLIGRPISHLAYPYGHQDDPTVADAVAVGFASAVTTEGRRLRRGDQTMQLPRLTINDVDGAAFSRRLEWAP
jgi:glycosyltransferase involved in cell wall biosynthesis/peptidoglycan/xylan/chitin deacetylase (PgdA/CDA1 family)